MAIALDVDLSLKHLSRVRAELFDFREKWYEIGDEFGLPKDKLDTIKQQARSQHASECLLRMLIEWLRAKDLKPSWRKVSLVVQKYSLEKILATIRNEIQEISSPNHDQPNSFIKVASVQPVEETDGVHIIQHDQVDGVSDETLSLNDLSIVRSELHEVRAKWYDIGLDLGLPVSTLDTILQQCQDNTECLRRMVQEWLKTTDPQPSWRTLINVLQNKVINEGALAITIAENSGVILTSSSSITKLRLPTPPPSLFQPAGVSQSAQSLQINWKMGPKAPTAFDLDSCAVKGNNVYYYCNTSNDIFKFNAEREEWSTVSPVCPQKSFTLVIIEGMLCAVGGEDIEEQQSGDKRSPIRGLMSKGPFKRWTEYFPQLTSQRNHVAAVYTQGVLIIAGGVTQSPQGDNTTNTRLVEILDVNKKQWYSTCSLPYSVQRPSIAKCGNNILISGAFDMRVYTTTFTSLLLNASKVTDTSVEATDTDQESIWQPIASCPTNNVYLAELDGNPITVGGLESENGYSKEIYMYNMGKDVWNAVGEVSKPQRFSQVAVLGEDKIVLAVGWTMDGFVDIVEIGTIVRSEDSDS